MIVYHNKEDRRTAAKAPSQLWFDSSGWLRFFPAQLIIIIIADVLIMLALSLFPSLPVITSAVLNALLLAVIIYLVFWTKVRKEMLYQHARFSETQAILRKSEERYRVLVESTDDSIYLVNREYCYVFINRNHLARLGFSADEFVGRPYSDFHSEAETIQFEAAVDAIFATGKSIQQEHKSDRDGLYFLRTLSPVRHENGTVSAVAVISKQITERKKMEEKLHKLSLTDELTGLYNRRGFMTHAAQQLKIANRLNRELLLIVADLDGLKIINDTMGHAEGDQALVDVAAILQETFRSSDIIARIGGDEFVALQMMKPEDTLPISIDRLQANIANHNGASPKPYKLSLSLGTVVYQPEHPKALEQLLYEADAMMYKQKNATNFKPRTHQVQLEPNLSNEPLEIV